MNISVIIPVFNAEKYIKKSVLSALGQYQVKEVILIEDCSKDSSLTVCKELKEDHDRVKLFVHENGENRGAGASRNLGIRMASCPFIAFLDGDDFFYENRFDRTEEVFSKNINALGVYEAVKRVFMNNEIKEKYKKWYNDNILITLNAPEDPSNLFSTILTSKNEFFHLNGLTIKREIIDIIGHFDESLIIAQDIDFILRACQTKALFPGLLDRAVCSYVIHGQNRVLDREKERVYRFLFTEKWFFKSINEGGWNKKLIYFMLRRYLATHPSVVKSDHNIMKRIKTKFFLIARLVCDNPSMIRKLI